MLWFSCFVVLCTLFMLCFNRYVLFNMFCGKNKVYRVVFGSNCDLVSYVGMGYIACVI